MANFITRAIRGLFRKGVPHQVTKFLGRDVVQGAEKLLDPRRAAAAARTSTLEEFSEFLGGKIVIANTPGKEAWYSKLIGMHEGWKGGAGYAEQGGFIALHPELAKKSFKETAISYGLSPEVAGRAVESEGFLKAVLYHESLERGMAGRFATMRQMPAKHFGSQVLVGEAGFIKEMGDKELETIFRTIRGRRKEERAAFRFGYNLFSADHGAWNTISGFPKTGMAAQSRPVATDFGSRSDPLRAIARGLGISFENMLRSPKWKEALASAKVVKQLGEGSFGKAELLETLFEGKAVQMVRKTLKPQRELEKLISSAANEKFYRRALDMSREAKAYRELGETPLVPSLYGGGASARDPIYMEFMSSGRMLADVTSTPAMAEKFRLPEHVRKQLTETIEAAAEKGIVNTDIHGGNILYDPIERKAAWIDWGLAGFGTGRHEAFEEMTRKAASIPGIMYSKRSIRELARGKRKPSPAEMKAMGSADTVNAVVEQRVSAIKGEKIKEASTRVIKKRKPINNRQIAEQLNSDKQQIWDNAYFGGRNHVRRKSASSTVR